MLDRRTNGLQQYRPAEIRARMDAPEARIPNVATRGRDAWAEVGRAAARAGLAVNDALAREYYRDQVARVDDAVLETSRKFELWKAQYNDQNRGKSGVEALKDYSEKFEQLRSEALEAFDGHDNEIFNDLLSSRLKERGLVAVREGARFGAEQKDAWLASQLAAQVADFGSYVAANPDDEEGIAKRRASVLASWAAKNPGLNPGATAARLNAEEFQQRMEGYLASGDTAGARELLGTYGRISGLGRSSSLSDWLQAHNNPGSVTVDGRDFAAYATRREGIRAIMGRFASYYKRGLRTPARIISTYAPPTENDTAGYIREVARATGLDPDRDIDIADPGTLAAMAGAVIMQEHSVREDPEELMEAAREFLQKGEPRAVGVISRDRASRQFLPGLDPASFQRYGERVAALEKREAAERDQARADLILEEIRQLPIERRTMEVLRVLEDMPREERERMRPLLRQGVENRKELDNLARTFEQQDAFSSAMASMPVASDASLTALAMSMAQEIGDVRIRENFKQYALEEIKNRRETRAALDAMQVESFLKEHQGQTPAQIRQALASSSLGREARERAADLAWGLARDENPDNLLATNLALTLKDAGALDSQSELEAYAQANRLTLAQVKQIQAYRGNAAQVSISRVNNILKNLTALGDFDGPDKIDARAYQIVLERLKPGHEPTDNELADLLSQLYTSNGAWFFSSTLMDQLIDGQFDQDWLPEVKAWQRPELERILGEQGILASERNMRTLLKLNIFNSQGWTSRKAPEWEK